MLKRSLFTYELLPVFRSARVAKFLFDRIVGAADRGKTFVWDSKSKGEFAKIFDRVLIAEGGDFFRCSELKGTSEANRISQKYLGDRFILKRDSILKICKDFWDIRGARVVCKEELRQELSSISRDFHPFCMLSLYFYDMLEKKKISENLLKRIVENLDYAGISSSPNPLYAENHLHLGGAFPTEKFILSAIDSALKLPQKKDFNDMPNADRDVILFDSLRSLVCILGNFSRYLFSRACGGDFVFAAEKRGRSGLNRAGLAGFCASSNKLFGDCSFSIMRNSKLAKFPLDCAIENEKTNPNRAFFYYLLFLWDMVFGGMQNSFDSEAAYMLIHIVNLIRSYSVMSASRGLEFFTKYYGSAVRKNKKDEYCFDSIFNSGTSKLQFRTGWNDIPKAFQSALRAKDSYKNRYAGLKINMVYHLIKKQEDEIKDFMREKKRKDYDEICKKLMCFAGSCESVGSEFRLRIKEHAGNRGEISKILQNRQGYARRVDFMRFLAGVDAAGNEESVPPEIYAPYMRRLAALSQAQERRARIPELFPPLEALKKAFHAGEDFEDIATGIRRIDETVKFLDYGRGDRISHALALGVDPQTWYSKKGDIRITKINLLDNLVWLFRHAKKIGTPEMLAFVGRHEDIMFGLARKLYSPTFKDGELTLENLYKAWEFRRNCPIQWRKYLSENQTGICKIYSNSLVPDICQKFEGGKESVASKLFNFYNEDRAFYKTACEFVNLRVADSSYGVRENMLEITSADIAAIRAVQDWKINEYSERGIIIEACPSSNIYIGDFDCAENHPVFRWNPPIKDWIRTKYNKSGLRKNAIKVCINTDDPAIFPTNLENEFCLMRNAAIKLLSPEENIEEVDEWIEKLKSFNEKLFDSNYREPFFDAE